MSASTPVPGHTHSHGEHATDTKRPGALMVIMSRVRFWFARLLLATMKSPRDVARFSFHRYSSRLAVVDGRRKVTYAELGERTFRIAAAWATMGVRRGTVIAVRLPDGVCQIEARLAAAECGAVLCLVPYWATFETVVARLEQVDPVFYVHDGKEPALCETLRRHLPQVRQLALTDSPQRWWVGAPARPCQTRVRSRDTLISVFSFGATDTPRLMSTTHGEYLAALRTLLKNVGVGVPGAKPDVTLAGIPLIGSGRVVLLPTLLAGGVLVVPPAYETVTLLKCIARFQVTRLFATPSTVIDILDHPDLSNTDVSSLRYLIYGTESMPVAKLEEALQRFGPILQQGYGSAEVLLPVSLLQSHQHMEGGRFANRSVLMSCGWVVPGVHVRVVDDKGRGVPMGKIGEVLVKSPTLFGGYHGRPNSPASSLVEGYLRIGDMGLLTPDGRLTLLGRKQDMLRADEGVIFPRTVEEVMHEHPAIKEAAYVQGPNGERVMAYSLRRTCRGRSTLALWAATLADHLRQRLPVWQQPQGWRYFEELPCSPLGKVLRKDVREQLARSKRAPRRRTLAGVLVEADRGEREALLHTTQAPTTAS